MRFDSEQDVGPCRPGARGCMLLGEHFPPLLGLLRSFSLPSLPKWTPPGCLWRFRQHKAEKHLKEQQDLAKAEKGGLIEKMEELG